MIALLALLLLQEETRTVDKAEGCIECHVDTVEELAGSVHQRETCIGCHGVDEINPKKTSGNPHLRRPTFKSWRGRNLTEDCASCHVAVYDSLKLSRHDVDTRKPKGDLKKGCLDCHFSDAPKLTPGGRAHGIPAASRGVILNTCRQCHAPATPEYEKSRRLFEDLDLFDGRIAAIELAARKTAGAPGISTRATTAAILGAKRTGAELRVRQHGLQFGALEALRGSSAGPLEAAYSKQSQLERDFEGRWKYLVPFLVFIAASLVFVQVKARKGAAA